MDIPVYLFTGFLDSGKSTFIQETLQDSRFNSGENTLLLICEEGEVEYDPAEFATSNVYLKTVDNEEDLNEATLKGWQKECKARRVIVEYNGMWQLKSLFSAMPREWIIYQEICFCEADNIISYNRNMRSLVADKFNACELVVFNRCSGATDLEELHKIVRSVSRKAQIAYEFKDGHVEYDEFQDPLPYDINSDEISIKDTDFAIWYYDLMENASAYNGKILEFLGIAAKDRKMAKLEFAIGRHIMTCCADDIQYGGIVANWDKAPSVSSGQWLRVKGKLKMEYNEMYEGKGPVLKVIEAEQTTPPKEKLVTLY